MKRRAKVGGFVLLPLKQNDPIIVASNSMGCPECEYLTDLYADLVRENADLLKEYHAALQVRDMNKVDLIREALPGIEQFRHQAKTDLPAHQATHNPTEQTDSVTS